MGFPFRHDGLPPVIIDLYKGLSRTSKASLNWGTPHLRTPRKKLDGSRNTFETLQVKDDNDDELFCFHDDHDDFVDYNYKLTMNIFLNDDF